MNHAKNTAAAHVSTIRSSRRKRINAMFNFLAFYVLFGVFMLRAYMLDWESIFSSSVFDEERHIFSFFINICCCLANQGLLWQVRQKTDNCAAQLRHRHPGPDIQSKKQRKNFKIFSLPYIYRKDPLPARHFSWDAQKTRRK